jgi:uncharacterized protein YraI
VKNAIGSVRLVAALLALGPLGAFAQEAFTRQPANVRAGPDRSYPLVAQLGPGSPVRVMGCLDDWTWCDIAVDDNRGWVYGPNLLYGVSGDRVALYTYGPSLGIAVIGFSLGGYWDEHYRQRSWYGARDDWARRAPPPHRVPSGLPAHAVYTAGAHVERGAPAATARPHAATPGRAERPANPPAAEHAPARAPQHAEARPAPEAHAAPQQAAAHEAPREAAAHEAPREAPRAAAPAREHAAGKEAGSEKGEGEKSPHEGNR